MNLLSSDYDGTIKVGTRDFYLNIEFIKEFMKNNVFLLNTGRKYESIMREVNYYGIDFDYLSCTDGNLVMDKEGRVLYCTNLDISDINSFLKLRNNYDCKVDLVTFEDNILEYKLVLHRFRNNIEVMSKANKICNDLGLVLKPFYEGDLVNCYITDKNISKSTSAVLVSKIEGINPNKIFTIGDEFNDFEMVKDFNGYTFPWGHEDLKEVSQGVCTSVHSLIKKMI